MSGPSATARTFQLRDLPLAHRLRTRGISMDSEGYLARGLHTVEDAALSQVPLARLGAPTLVACYGRIQIIGQYRYKPGEPSAHITFIAPAIGNESDEDMETAWLCLLDALAKAAGSSGAHILHAEVDENSRVFEILRQAGYAAYARQDIWRRAPAPLPDDSPAVFVGRASQADLPMIRWCYGQLVPRLAQQADPALPAGGLLYQDSGQVKGYLAVHAGNRGIYLKPYLLPEAVDEAQAFIEAALLRLAKAATLPVYCSARRYQSELNGPLDALSFRPWMRQTVMVKHTSARVKHVDFEPVRTFNNQIAWPNINESHWVERQPVDVPPVDYHFADFPTVGWPGKETRITKEKT